MGRALTKVGFDESRALTNVKIWSVKMLAAAFLVNFALKATSEGRISKCAARALCPLYTFFLRDESIRLQEYRRRPSVARGAVSCTLHMHMSCVVRVSALEREVAFAQRVSK